MSIKTLKTLSKKIGYQFNDIQLLELALTHRSIGNNNNERLEFLGDSILNLTIADALFHQFPKEKEGKLSRLRASMVKGDTLAIIAKEFGLGEYLILGPGELKSGGFRRESILADAVEAIIGAISLDSDWECARACTLRWYESRLKVLDPKDINVKDAKSRLQEYLQSRQKSLPQYEVVNITGKDHNQMFEVNCKIEDLPHVVSATAESRRIAEQKVAKKALVSLGIDNK
ncbi:ribonuclease III [Marinicellulosiphila megalodicopiae]|uniref:ribonuclease III n=1 Tax=Marinicellulosiphila megalodicopiae TaxID=2724896 RepID=UPI003BB03F42